jgi:uncharacterized membrane protein YbhN (UPF0104 family)
MGKLAWLVGGTAGGAVGWWAGESFGFMTAFILSTVGTGIGIYLARRWLDQYQ